MLSRLFSWPRISCEPRTDFYSPHKTEHLPGNFFYPKRDTDALWNTFGTSVETMEQHVTSCLPFHPLHSTPTFFTALRFKQRSSKISILYPLTPKSVTFPSSQEIHYITKEDGVRWGVGVAVGWRWRVGRPLSEDRLFLCLRQENEHVGHPFTDRVQTRGRVSRRPLRCKKVRRGGGGYIDQSEGEGGSLW